MSNFSGNHMSEQKISQYTELFMHYDYYTSGTIHMHSLKMIVASMNVALSPSVLQNLLAETGNNNPTMITLSQFLAIISLLIQDTEMDRQIEQTFKLFDIDKSGVIDSKDIKTGFVQLGIEMKDGEIEQMMRVAKKSEIDYETFHKSVLNK